MRPQLTPLSHENRTHLTANGALALCGRAITNAWRRVTGWREPACEECDHIASRPELIRQRVPPRYEAQGALREEEAAAR